MKARIFIFSSGSAENEELLTDVIRRSFADCLANEEGLRRFESLQAASDFIAGAFSDAEAVLFFTEKSAFSETKKSVARAFGLTMEPHSAVAQIMGERLSDEESAEYHTMLPKGSKPFLTDRGDYSGFAFTKGRQTLFYLPFSFEETAKLLYSQVIPFINSIYASGLETAFAEHMYAPMLENSVTLSKTEVALANTPVTQLFTEYYSVCDALKTAVKVSPLSEARRGTDPKTYVVNQSIAAAEFLGLPYGLAVSNAYYKGTDINGPKTVYIAVTNDEQTIVRSVISETGEHNTDFLNRCFGEACRLLSEVIDTDAGRAARKKVPKDPNEGLKEKKPLSGKKFAVLLIIMLVLLFMVVGFGVFYFSLSSYTLKDWFSSVLRLITGIFNRSA